MTTDDRDDIEPLSPSSFKVGEVDRLSGFFTPVWESKRRLRAESPIPATSAAATSAATPSSAPDVSSEPARDSVEPAQRPSTPPPARQAAAPGPFIAAGPPRASRPPLERRPIISPAPARHTPSPAAASPANATSAGKKGAEPARTASRAVDGSASKPTPTLAPQNRVPPRADAATSAAPPSSEQPAVDPTGVGLRPVIPMPQNPGRTPPRAKASSAPPAAAAGPSRRPIEPVVLEREPELRTAPPTSAPPARPSWPSSEQRAARAAGVAAVLHDKLRTKPVDSVDTLARHRETESEREALQRAAVRAAATPPDPYPTQLLRTLRRTFHLSMPLPESVRAMIDKYRY